MKKVIKNKVYDTETAKKYSSYKYDTLYQKKTGEFFIYNSKSDTITPLNYEDAEKWGCRYMKIEDFSKVFGETAENAEKKIISLSIRKDTREKLKKAAAIKGMTVSQYIEELVNNVSEQLN